MKSSTSPTFNPMIRITPFFVVTLMIHAGSLFILALYYLLLLVLLINKTIVSLEDFGRLQPIIALSMLLVLLIWGLTYLLVIILFPAWFYKAYKNLKPLRAFNISYGSWAPIYSWFTPILFLFRPFQIAKEIWIESDPDFDPELNYLSLTSKAAPFISMWWVFHIIVHISSFTIIYARYIFEINVGIEFTLIIGALLYIESCLEALCAVRMIKEIPRRQRQRFDQIVRYENANVEDNYQGT